jgi:glycosyltransferase involved in cell wall biosynthesis
LTQRNNSCNINADGTEETGMDIDNDCRGTTGLRNAPALGVAPEIVVSLLTGGIDQPYAFGLATALLAKGAAVDLIGGDHLDCPEFRDKRGVLFLNLRGAQRPDASFARKVYREIAYYVKLIRYAWSAKPKIFHILWNNKFPLFDRTLLTLYYRWLGKSIVLTAHNVNAGRRDSNDTALNRVTLRIQYRLADHIFVHTETMKRELIEAFHLHSDRVSVIPFGINNATPNTHLSRRDAKLRLGIGEGTRTLLFFGRIAPYKGLEYLLLAFSQLLASSEDYRLVIAGRPKNCEKYWAPIREELRDHIQAGRVLLRADFIPDEETEVYFKAADVLILPYKHIYQSGVLFLAYSFGLPVIAADVGSLKDDIVEGQNGFLFRPQDCADLSRVIERYFGSTLFAELESRRQGIREFAMTGHSWDVVAQSTIGVYSALSQTAACPPVV